MMNILNVEELTKTFVDFEVVRPVIQIDLMESLLGLGTVISLPEPRLSDCHAWHTSENPYKSNNLESVKH